jgi:hypothetical protein
MIWFVPCSGRREVKFIIGSIAGKLLSVFHQNWNSNQINLQSRLYLQNNYPRKLSGEGKDSYACQFLSIFRLGKKIK